MAIRQETAAELFSSLSALLRTSRSIGQRTRDLGASGTALGVLKALQHGDSRPGDLASALHVVPSVISRATAPLEAQGLIERKDDPQDARASLLGLTGLGRSRLAELQQVYVEQLCQTLDGWTDADAERAALLLTRLEQALGSHPLSETHRQRLTDVLLPPSTPSTEKAHA